MNKLKKKLNETLKYQNQKINAEVNLEECRIRLIRLFRSYLYSFDFTCLDCYYSKGTIDFNWDFVDNESVENAKEHQILANRIYPKLNVKVVFIDEYDLHKAREELQLFKRCYYEKNTAKVSIVLKEEVINLLEGEK